MITGNIIKEQISQVDYRLTERLSYSSIKEFDNSRLKFYKKHILKDQSIEIEKSTALILGDIVDCQLFSPELFDDKFVVANCLKPSGQIGEFVDALCNITLKSLGEDLQITRDATEMMEEAFNKVKYDSKGAEVAFKKKDFKWLLENFIGSEAESYYKECRSQFGKIVVDINMINTADKIIAALRECPFTESIVNAETDENIEVIDQLPIMFNLLGIDVKAMPDRIIIYKNSKIIQPFDLKVTYSGEDFPYNYWKNKYYLQVAMYNEAIKYWVEKERPDLKDFELKPIEFIVGSSTLQSNPLRYVTSEQNLVEGLNGFTLRNGKYCKGLLTLIKEITWHSAEGEWKNSKEVWDNLGIMSIKPFEQTEE